MADDLPRDDVARALLSFGETPLPYQTFARAPHQPARVRTGAGPAASQTRATPPRNAASSRFPLIGAALAEAASVEVSDSAAWLPQDDAAPSAESVPPSPQPVSPPQTTPTLLQVVQMPRAGSVLPSWAARESDTSNRRLSVVVREQISDQPGALSQMFSALGAARPPPGAENVKAESSLGRLLGSL